MFATRSHWYTYLDACISVYQPYLVDVCWENMQTPHKRLKQKKWTPNWTKQKKTSNKILITIKSQSQLFYLKANMTKGISGEVLNVSMEQAQSLLFIWSWGSHGVIASLNSMSLKNICSSLPLDGNHRKRVRAPNHFITSTMKETKQDPSELFPESSFVTAPPLFSDSQKNQFGFLTRSSSE